MGNRPYQLARPLPDDRRATRKVVAQVVDGSTQGEHGEQPEAAEREAAEYVGQQ
jgi:hypothetical protein